MPLDPAMITIHELELPAPGIEQLQQEALQEGFHFIERLLSEWQSGANRFGAQGEKFYGCTVQGVLVAIGGINQDPFAAQPGVGRIRRVYVRPAWRNKGIGTALIRALVDTARTNFKSLQLRTDNPTAARLYERVGFTRTTAPNATHVLPLNELLA